MKFGFLSIFTNFFLCGSVGAGVLRNTLKIRTQCGYGWAPKNSGCQCTLLFSKITRSRWKEENNRLLFSITGIDDQGLRCDLLIVLFIIIWSNSLTACTFKKDKLLPTYTKELLSFWYKDYVIIIATCKTFIYEILLSKSIFGQLFS